jgi:uncharacterized membrane protein YeaQ/YmgE (transglycosylase-associated protein family)
MPVSILSWIVFGLIAGFVSSFIVNRKGEGLVLDLVLGVVGALIGGWIMTAIGREGITGFNLHSFLVAIAGSVILLFVLHLFRRTSVT